MTVLELSFPAGRYHATPWGRHVNEGAVEWPPSPWRILRALIATWYLKAREIPEPTVRSLVEKLSSPPHFRLPRASTSHTRHYMPYNEGKNEKSTKVFDTFIQLEEGFKKASTWRSLTPFVSTRHAKTYRDGRPKIAPNGKQDGSPEHDLLRLLEKHHPTAFARLGEIGVVKESGLPFTIGRRRFRSLQFQTRRGHGEGRRGNGSGTAFTITFTEPVAGPLALGYGSHFGLGLFQPVADSGAAPLDESDSAAATRNQSKP